MDHGEKLIKLALFGQPIKASLSPKIHRMFADQFGLDIAFQRIEIGANGFPDALAAFRLEGGCGCNVTLPLKRDAWQLADDSSLEVSQAQAANTLVRNDTGGWFAHNTDGTGLVSDLKTNHGIDLTDARILVLGAGGAASGILGSLLAAGAGQIVLVNRNQQRAGDLVDRFNATASLSATSWQALPASGKFDLLINATSLGHQGTAPPLADSLFSNDAVCYDLNYLQASLPLKRLCEQIKRPYIDGLGMLVEQAAKSFHIWTRKQPETKAVIQACRA